uniref:Uncharacterized protein n=1 Tax=Arundo donax TaxID=35708 RepID=A0A0A9CVX5_ARUDO
MAAARDPWCSKTSWIDHDPSRSRCSGR